ncbi:MAG TPA: cation diffusion facilitator family transporter [Terriglobales bacterium]|nr:cation diffusion facilitator family transporter [Terriglobales bacterium]
MHAHAEDRASRVLQLSLLATLAYIVVCVVVGIQARSLALISEAGHNVSDLLALLLSLVAVYLHARPPSSSKTYGYQRAGVLAAFVNALSLAGLTFYLFYEAAHRLYAPVEVHARPMIAVAAAGIVMNATIALAIYRTGRDVNLRSVLLHELGDTLSTAAVVAGGWGILTTGQNWIDPALSFGIGALILWSAFGILRETLNILLEGAPRGIELDRIAQDLRSIEGVEGVHDLHVWSLGSEHHALSCHIRIPDIPPSASERILRAVNERLRQRFHIHHTTIQFEHAACEVVEGCAAAAVETRAHTH